MVLVVAVGEERKLSWLGLRRVVGARNMDVVVVEFYFWLCGLQCGMVGFLVPCFLGRASVCL